MLTSLGQRNRVITNRVKFLEATICRSENRHELLEANAENGGKWHVFFNLK